MRKIVLLLVLSLCAGSAMAQSKVMTRKDATDKGLNQETMRAVEYKSAYNYNTETERYDTTGIVRTDAEMETFSTAWQQFIGGIGTELQLQGFVWDKVYRGFCVVYFNADGTVAYFIYNFLGDILPTAEQQQQFEEILTKYVEKTAINYKATRKFSQCGGLVFQPSK